MELFVLYYNIALRGADEHSETSQTSLHHLVQCFKFSMYMRSTDSLVKL